MGPIQNPWIIKWENDAVFSLKQNSPEIAHNNLALIGHNQFLDTVEGKKPHYRITVRHIYEILNDGFYSTNIINLIG